MSVSTIYDDKTGNKIDFFFFDKELVYLIASIHTEKTTRFTRENNYYTFFFTFDLQKTSRSAELA